MCAESEWRVCSSLSFASSVSARVLSAAEGSSVSSAVCVVSPCSCSSTSGGTVSTAASHTDRKVIDGAAEASVLFFLSSCVLSSVKGEGVSSPHGSSNAVCDRGMPNKSLCVVVEVEDASECSVTNEPFFKSTTEGSAQLRFRCALVSLQQRLFLSVGVWACEQRCV